MGMRVFAAAAVAALCWTGAAAAGESLKLYTWADYTAPELLERFKAETGITVEVTTFDSYEVMLDTLKDGKSAFDLAVPAEYDVRELAEAGAIERIEAFRLTGFENVEENWRGQYYDPGNDFSLPWHWGTTSFVYDSAVVKTDSADMALLFDPPPGVERVGFLDDGDEVVTLALRYLGLPRCTSDTATLTAIERFLSQRAKRMVIFDADNPVEWLVKAKSPVNMAWNGDAMRARMAKPSLRYAYPREGVTVWTDTLVVPTGARNKAAALRFMAFMLRPENAALQSNFSGYANAVRGSDDHLSPELLAAPEVIIPPGAKLEFLQACDGAVYEGYRAIWARVKKAGGRTP